MVEIQKHDINPGILLPATHLVVAAALLLIVIIPLLVTVGIILGIFALPYSAGDIDVIYIARDWRLGVLADTTMLAVIATALSVMVWTPLVTSVWLSGGRRFLLVVQALVLLTFFSNPIIKTHSVKVSLQNGGLIDNFVSSHLGGIDILYTDASVILGLIISYSSIYILTYSLGLISSRRSIPLAIIDAGYGTFRSIALGCRLMRRYIVIGALLMLYWSAFSVSEYQLLGKSQSFQSVIVNMHTAGRLNEIVVLGGGLMFASISISWACVRSAGKIWRSR